jgi:hypothetical protein
MSAPPARRARAASSVARDSAECRRRAPPERRVAERRPLGRGDQRRAVAEGCRRERAQEARRQPEEEREAGGEDCGQRGREIEGDAEPYWRGARHRPAPLRATNRAAEDDDRFLWRSCHATSPQEQKCTVEGDVDHASPESSNGRA